MNFDKKTIIAIALIGLVLLFIQTDLYKDNFLPPPPVTEDAPDFKQSVMEESEKVIRQTEAEKQIVKTSQPSKGRETILSTLVEGQKGEDIVVENNLYRATFSTKGGGIRLWELEQYENQYQERVQLVGEDGFGNLGIKLPHGADTLDTSKLIFSATKSEIRITQKKSHESLEFLLDLGEGKRLKKTYTFFYDSYAIELQVEFINLNNFIEGFSYYLTWQSGMQSNESNLKLDMESSYGYAFQGDKEEFSISDEPEVETFDNSTDWVGIRTKYFATAVIPKKQGQSVKFYGDPVDVGQEVPLKKYAFDLQMPYDQSARKVDNFTVFLGPLDFDTVESFGVGLEEMMDLGWAPFRPFGKFVLWSFKLLHSFIPNYGLVIIIFSILIKILLFPLTKKSYQSMKQMQIMQPVIQEMNEKYKDDPKKKQAEMMKIYKDYGINPLGGCIPMVLQMPLLIALFNIFRSTIELRGAYFVGWITDLSLPDTVASLPFTIPMYGNKVNILPLVMGVTMFIQQKITMKDPKQKAMVYFMPLFLTLMFNSFPSGLNLYYALFNVLSIVQEKFIPYKVKSLEELKAAKAQKKKKPRRKYDYKKRN